MRLSAILTPGFPANQTFLLFGLNFRDESLGAGDKIVREAGLRFLIAFIGINKTAIINIGNKSWRYSFSR